MGHKKALAAMEFERLCAFCASLARQELKVFDLNLVLCSLFLNQAQSTNY
jgi:hypothetical protein